MAKATINFVRLGARVFQSCYDIMLKKPTQFTSPPGKFQIQLWVKIGLSLIACSIADKYEVNGAEFSPTTSIGITVCFIAPTINNFIAFYN